MNDRSEDTAFLELVDNYFEQLWRYFPMTATFLGIHNYDDQLNHLDKDTRKEFLDKERKWLRQLDGFAARGQLSPERRLDLDVLKAELTADLAGAEYINKFERDPAYYPGNAVFACLILIMRDFRPKEERYHALVSRLKDIPRYMADAKANLRLGLNIPTLWILMARQITRSSQQFFSHLITNIAGEIPALRNDIMAAATLASKTFDDYESFLEKELGHKPTGPFAAGHEYFNQLLKQYHFLPYDSEQIEQIGHEIIEKTIEEMTTVSKDIDPYKRPDELIEEIKAQHPGPDDLLEAYRREVERGRDFIIKNNLVTLPADEILEVVETPATERATLPYGAYMPPAPFEKSQRGFFWVTPIDQSTGHERRAEQLAGHNRAAIEVRALHEGYPGHHLQLCLANRLDSKVRQVYGTSVFVEGWALYCEQMMKEKGFFTSRRSDLIQLKDQLWRACRVVIDVRLHTGRFSFEEAVEMLVNIARLERSNAEAEIKRYSQSPTQPLSYLIGKMEIERLARDYRNRYPTQSLCEFHDRLLSFGSVPIGMIRSALLGTN